MKKIFTLVCVLGTAMFSHLKSQVVLNELYSLPGSTTHEFFELFNTGTESTSSSVDGFTIVTYFEEGTTKGFYVLDVPALSIGPRGYLVGSAALPFNYQGVTNSNNSHFSWNDPNLSSNSGFLQKWVLTGSDASDGNLSYNQATVPANLNDFFNKKSGGGFSYAVFIFKNGLLVNNFYGGTGGATTQPASIKGMPTLNLQYRINNVNSNFSVNFSTLSNADAEYVVADAGTDNGYIREKDGVCGTWVKSSNSLNHTPMSSNGASTAGTGTITISASIVRGVTAGSTSLLTYDITAGTTTSFPVNLQVYLDNGSVPGDLDASDTYLANTIQNSVADPAATLNFTPINANIIVVAETAAGCFGQVKSVTAPINSTLPVKLVSFNSILRNNKVQLTWTVDENETASLFELERSQDGSVFQNISAISAKEMGGLQAYSYADGTDLKHTIYYRLRMTDINNRVEYSRVLVVRPSGEYDKSMKLVQNPVQNKLFLSIESESRDVVQVRIMDVTGRQRLVRGVQVHEGTNILSIDLPNEMSSGMYVAAVVYDRNSIVRKFLKN